MNVKKEEWERWYSRRITPRLAEHWGVCSSKFKKFFEVEFPDLLFLTENDICYGYGHKKQLKDCLKNILNNLYNSSFYQLYEKQALQQFDSFLSYCKNIANSDLNKLDNKDLQLLFEEFLDKEDDFTCFLWIIFAVDFLFPKELEKQLKENSLDKYHSIILASEKMTEAAKLSIDILELASKKLNKENLEKEIEKLRKKYHFFTIINFDEEPFDVDYFKREIDRFLAEGSDPKEEIQKINNQFEKNKKDFENFIKTLDPKSKIYKIAEACHKISYYRDHRNDIRRKAYFYVRELYKEIAKRLNLTLTQTIYLKRSEINESLEKGKLIITKKEIKNRKDFFGLAMIDKNLIFVKKEEIEKLLDLLEKEKKEDSIKGTPASPGLVKGKAKIVLIPQKDGGKIQQGDILVTSMTNIDFVPLMSKAAAIVTDEGGITCHAAIVARELKKPCIIGTKIATKVFHDGDLVEVDANKGIVKKLK